MKEGEKTDTEDFTKSSLGAPSEEEDSEGAEEEEKEDLWLVLKIQGNLHDSLNGVEPIITSETLDRNLEADNYLSAGRNSLKGCFP